MLGILPGNGLIAIRLQTSEAASVLSHIDASWQDFYPEYPNEVFFLDASFATQYASEDRLVEILGSFALLTILIACLGLAGLAAFSTAQRTREIGIRKTLGATSTQVVRLLSTDFLKPVAVAVVLASVAGWMIASRWLEGYAYHTEIGVIEIGISVAIMVFIATMTVSMLSYRASRLNPAISVRYE